MLQQHGLNGAIVDGVDDRRDLIGDVVTRRPCAELDNAGVEPMAMGFSTVSGTEAGTGFTEFVGQSGQTGNRAAGLPAVGVFVE